MSPRTLNLLDLELAIREIKVVTDCLEIVVGGCGALVACGRRSEHLLRTVDFDIGITREHGLQGIQSFTSLLGEESQFANQHGFYIENAGESLLTDRLPDGWRERATKVEVEGVVALCLAPVDIAINKLDAKRPKDFKHLALMIQESLVTVEAIEDAIMRGPYTFLIPEYLDSLAKVQTLAISVGTAIHP